MYSSIKEKMIQQNEKEWLINMDSKDVEYICRLGNNMSEYESTCSNRFGNNEGLVSAYFNIIDKNQLDLKKAKGVLACILIHERSLHPNLNPDVNELDKVHEILSKDTSTNTSFTIQCQLTKDENFKDKVGLYMTLITD